MSFQLCFRCLRHLVRRDLRTASSIRPSRDVTRSNPSALFSTSSSLQANPVKKKTVIPAGRSGRGGKSLIPQRGVRQTLSKKNKPQKSKQGGRRPGIGERKALRKRVVLSNTNALEVAGLRALDAQHVASEESIGQVFSIPGPIVDRLRAVEAFKPHQGWSLFRRPAMLMRKETVEFGKAIENISTGGQAQSIRRVLVGERASGKTVMLLQVMALAMLKNWVVINIPEGISSSHLMKEIRVQLTVVHIAMDITIAHTEYAPIPGTTPIQYIQPQYTASLLRATAQANPILSSLHLSEAMQKRIATLQTDRSKKPTGSVAPQAASGSSSSESSSSGGDASFTELPPFAPNITLSRLASLGAENPQYSHAVFHLLLSELKQPSRPPLLFCLEGLGFAMRATKYIDGIHYKPIHAHDFNMIRTYLSHLSGAEPLGPSGGIVLASISESNRPHVEAMDVALGQIEQSSTTTPSSFVSSLRAVTPMTNALGGRVIDRGTSLMELAGGIPFPSPGVITRDPFKTYDDRVMQVFGASQSSPSNSKESTPAATAPKIETTKPTPNPQTEESPPPFDETRANIPPLFGRGGITVQRLRGLDRMEARGLLEYWAQSGMVRQRVDDRYVGEKWSLAGGGVIGELERCVVRARL